MARKHNTGGRAATPASARGGRGEFLGRTACVGLALSIVGSVFPGRPVNAQEPVTADARRPESNTRRIDELLARPVTVTLDRVSRKRAVDAVSTAAKVPVQYQSHMLDAFRDSITLRLAATPLREALERILAGTNLRVVADGDAQLAIVKTTSDGAAKAAQQRGKIMGRVIDSATGRGLPRVSILIDGKVSGATTNGEGSFTIADVPAGERTVAAKLLGFRTVQRRVMVGGGDSVIVQLTLAPSATVLTGVVTTAVGEQRRLDVANSVTRLNVDSIRRDAPITSVTDLLEGRVPDLMVTRGSGAPGSPSRIRIRGLSSINGSNDPIVIVDNVRVYSEQTTTTVRNDAAFSVIDNIDVHTIESIDVLKGPSASALYGSDAANGVIVIKTKRGQAGPTRWTLSIDQGRTSQPTYLGERAYLEGTALEGGLPQQCDPGAFINTCFNAQLFRYNPLADDRTTVLATGHNQRYALSVSGGSSLVRYFLSAQTSGELGVLKMSEADVAYLERTTGRSVPSWQRRPQSSTQTNGTATLTLLPLPSLTVNLTSTLGRTGRASTPLASALGVFQSATPRDTSLVTGSIRDFRRQLTWREQSSLHALSADWIPLQWMTTHADMGVQTLVRDQKSLMRRGDCPGCTGGDNGALSSDRGDRSVTTVNMRGTVRLPRTAGVRLTPTFGANYVRTYQSSLPVTASNLALGNSSASGAGSVSSGGEATGELIQLGVFMTSEINLFDRITTAAGVRVDASNALGQNVTPAYPKLDLSYVVPVERWFAPSAVSVVRVRTSYGHSAKQPELGASLRTYSTMQGVRDDGTVASLLTLKTLGNPSLRPERSTDFEGGIDATVWNDRITLSMTGYRKRSKDALVTVPRPLSLGGSGPGPVAGPMVMTTNLGEVLNSGGNVQIEARVIDRPWLVWGVNTSYERNRNTLVRLAPAFNTDLRTNGEAGDFYGSRYVEGFPLNGVWIKPIVSYADENGDGFLGYDEIVRSDSTVFVGGPLPNYAMTFGTVLGLWRGRVTIAGNAQYQNGMSQVNRQILASASASTSVISTASALNDPTVPLAIQAAYRSGYAAVHQVSTFRLQSLSIRTVLPERYTRRLLRASTMSVALQGNNLRLWTNYSGADPNVTSDIAGSSVRDNGVLPEPRTWGLNFTLTY